MRRNWALSEIRGVNRPGQSSIHRRLLISGFRRTINSYVGVEKEIEVFFDPVFRHAFYCVEPVVKTVPLVDGPRKCQHQ